MLQISQTRCLVALFGLLLSANSLFAQPGGDRGDRGGDRGGGRGGGWGGGGMMGGPGGGMMGGPPGGMMGGPPGGMMGGPPGGGMMMMGGMGRGGFDPSSFLTRLDANGNGSIDPDEMQGPARFFIDRMAQGNPKLDITKPIPLSTITAEFERMRSGRGGGGEGGGSFWGGGGWGGGEEEIPLDESKSLVPGFGRKDKPPAVNGFGASAEIYTVRVGDEDLREAEDRLRRYDTNKDGLLDSTELQAGRWGDNPMQYDRNGDGKVSKEELGVRYARRRIAKEQQGGSSEQSGGDRGRSGGGGWGGGGGGWGGQAAPAMASGGGEKEEAKDSKWKSIASYRTAPSIGKESKVQGLPGWFTDQDISGDGQVSMKEFASTWNETVLEKFLQFDTNKDGMITTKECLTATKNGILADRTSSSSSSANAANGATASSGAAAGASAGDTKGLSTEGLPADAEARWVKWCADKLSKADANKNGVITVDEWAASDGDFSSIDSNSDGQVTLAEYYAVRKSKKK